jgi:hypothetical protein
MVTKDGLPVLLDFGLARAELEESAVMTRADEVFGTPAYPVPRAGEQRARRRPAHRRVLAGRVLQESLTLERPTSSDSSGSSSHALRAHIHVVLAPLASQPAQDLIVVLETATEGT